MNFLFSLIIFTSFALADLISPVNNSELRAIHILFEWEQEPNAIAYNLRVFNSNDNVILDIIEESTVYIDTNNFDWDSDYSWQVRVIYSAQSFSEWSQQQFFSTSSSTLTNLNINEYNPDLVENGIMIYSQFLPYFAVGAIDNDGNEVWNTQTGYMNHISEFGEIYGVLNDKGVKYNFNHDILWQSPDNSYAIDSHEVKQIPNGNFMAFATIYQNGPIPIGAWTNYFQILGYTADGVTEEIPWLGLRIVEFDKDTGEEVWSWNPFEHFSMEDSDLYGGNWWGAAFNGFFDWMHTNAFHFDEEEGVIYVSHRHLSRISKIAYPSGEVIWNMGLPAEYNTGDDNICTELLFSFQHHIQLMDNGDLLFFDNGNISDLLYSEENPTTRIRRVRVIDDSYCETVWQYDLPPNLHGLGMGSVQLLDNENYSIYTYGSGLDEGECSILEINQDGELLWKATSQNENAAWYRSYKVPSIYPDAFSVIANNYVLEDDQNVIHMIDNSINFTIHNKSGYTQPYQFSFGESTDGPPMFDYEEGNFTLAPNESIELSFAGLEGNISSTNINFSIWPIHHNYALKELSFNIIANDILVGDVNLDGELNVLDVVTMVNIILSGEFNSLADLNNDNSNNVLDIVQLVNIILS